MYFFKLYLVLNIIACNLQIFKKITLLMLLKKLHGNLVPSGWPFSWKFLGKNRFYFKTLIFLMPLTSYLSFSVLLRLVRTRNMEEVKQESPSFGEEYLKTFWSPVKASLHLTPFYPLYSLYYTYCTYYIYLSLRKI